MSKYNVMSVDMNNNIEPKTPGQNKDNKTNSMQGIEEFKH